VADSADGPLLNWLNHRVQALSRASVRHPLATDATLAAAVAAVDVVALIVLSSLNVRVLLICAGLSMPLLLRHRSAALCFALIAAVAFIQWLVAGPQFGDVALLIALYFVALESEPPVVLAAAATAEAGAVMAATRWATGAQLKYWVGLSGLVVASTALGLMVRQRRALLLSLQERAARLERERDQQGRLGAAAERARIAREMHDIVSHNLSVMIALADGAGYALRSSPQRAAAAIDQVSATGRQALLEMRRLLGVLREDEAEHPFEPQPSLDRLEALLAGVDAAGVNVTVDLDGDPRALGDGVQLTVFRVAQEALTNTLKHAERPTSAHVALHCRGGEVDLEVTNTGSPSSDPAAAAPAGAPPPMSGRGLRGMRERASAYGGEVDAGPTPDGGWRVHLHLPSAGAIGRRSTPARTESLL
jgi:signal transduction histidine kinase